MSVCLSLPSPFLLNLQSIKNGLTVKMEAWVDRYTLSPHTTKRTTTDLKTKHNQNCYEVKWYGKQTTKESKRKHWSRLVGRAARVERIWDKAAAGRPGVPHLHADKPGGTTGKWDKPHNPGLQCGEIKPQNLWLQTPVGIAAVGGNPSLRRVRWR